MTDDVASRRRVLVVDDSAFMRRLVRDVVQSSGEFEVVGTARDGEEALRQIAALKPDLITLDIDMPALDGLAALRHIMQQFPRPVVMLSAGGSDGGAEATLQALEAGAVDFVRKPSGAISLDLERVTDRLLSALRAAARAQIPPRAPACSLGETAAVASAATSAPSTSAPSLQAAPRLAPRYVVTIAASTGGPAALAQIMPALPWWPDVAVVIAQHMPPGFTTSLAQRLHRSSTWVVQEAVNEAPLLGGAVYVAPGGQHCRIAGTSAAPSLALDASPPLWGVRPAADFLFASAALRYGTRAIGVVLTGMGRDGAAGLRAVREAGGIGLVQEASSCIVNGMPAAALREAGADVIVPLADIARTLADLVTRLRQDVAA